jgi:hypothetical protein
MTARSDKPAPVALNLDTLDREARPGPFSVVLGGKPYVFLDPEDIDWRDLLHALKDPSVFFNLMLPADKSKAWAANKLPGWKLNALMDNYIQHYGLQSSPEAPASPPR